MTLIDRDLPDAAGNVEGQKPRRATLGFVLHEPLMSMLKVERAPPPVFVCAARPTQTEHSSRPTPPVLSGRQKLAEAEFRIGLSQLAIQNEAAIAESGDQNVIDGFDEVCRFLRDCELLRVLQQN